MLQQMTDGGRFMPHGMCYLWEPDLLWLHVVSDLATGAAYLAIPPTLLLLVTRARQQVPAGADYASKRLPHEWMFLMFGLFIVACGSTHFMAAWNVWNADYWASGGVKALTALASVATAVALPPLVPRVLQVIHDARQSDLRREQLEAANRELASLNEQLRRMDEQRTRFFANVSHELRTPLTLILGPIQQQIDLDPPPALRRDLELVRSNATLLERRVSDLLDLSRSGEGEAQVSVSPVDVAHLLHDTADRFRALVEERRIQLEVDAPASLPLETDRDKVERVVDNLVTNAFKFTAAGGAVRLTARTDRMADDTQLVVQVADSGPGIAPEDRERVFDRFRQIGGSDIDGLGGSGLGLAIVRDFVHLLGGTVEVDEAPDLGGALFTVRIPARPTERAARDTATADASTRRETRRETRRTELAGTAAPRGSEDPEPGRAIGDGTGADAGVVSGPGRSGVLIVEDVPDMRGFLSRALRDGYEVRVASGGEEALRLLDDWSPDLVVTDLMMPGMDGESLVEAIRRRPALEEVPVLVLSARADEEMRIRLLGNGAQDYLTKPFAVAELKARVRNLVAMKRVRDLLRSQLQGATGDIHSLALELQSRHHELERVLAEVRDARDEAEGASRVKSEFLAVMSHELRTPLNGIIGYADLIKMGTAGPVTPDQERYLDRIGEGARQLVGIIDDILVFSREGSRPRPVEPVPVDVDGLVSEVLDGIVPAARQKGLRLEREVPAGLRMSTDRERLRRVLANLASNAVKFTVEGSVRLSVEEDVAAVVFRVRDTGIGISPEDRERVFDPFWQVDQSSTRTQSGTGLGLSIVRRLVEQLEGTIEVESRPGEGSTFTLRLPRELDTHPNHNTGQRKST